MADLIQLVRAVASWPTGLAMLLVFGFTPGFALRLLVRIYPRSHPRRKELVAELYALGWVERPLFVVQQLETVLFEGVPYRFKALRKRSPGDVQLTASILVDVGNPGDPWWTWALQWIGLGERGQAEHVLMEGIKAGCHCLWEDLVWIPAQDGDHERVEHYARLAADAGHEIAADQLVRIRQWMAQRAT